MKVGSERKPGGGRKILDMEMERDLSVWWIN